MTEANGRVYVLISGATSGNMGELILHASDYVALWKLLRKRPLRCAAASQTAEQARAIPN